MGQITQSEILKTELSAEKIKQKGQFRLQEVVGKDTVKGQL
jgi:hypothetical protein